MTQESLRSSLSLTSSRSKLPLVLGEECGERRSFLLILECAALHRLHISAKTLLPFDILGCIEDRNDFKKIENWIARPHCPLQYGYLLICWHPLSILAASLFRLPHSFSFRIFSNTHTGGLSMSQPPGSACVYCSQLCSRY